MRKALWELSNIDYDRREVDGIREDVKKGVYNSAESEAKAVMKYTDTLVARDLRKLLAND